MTSPTEGSPIRHEVPAGPITLLQQLESQECTPSFFPEKNYFQNQQQLPNRLEHLGYLAGIPKPEVLNFILEDFRILSYPH